MNKFITEAQRILQEEHNCHTIILYGSYAKGDPTPRSDVDMMGVSDSVTTVKRDARLWQGVYLDLFIYPTEKLLQPDKTALHFRVGKVLLERDGLGSKFVAELNKIFERGPEKLPQDELEARRIWYKKMLDRASLEDIEGNYRKHWLLTALLEDYFHLRNLWYQGSKDSFAWLQANDPEVYALFESCLKDSASLEQIQTLTALVASESRI